MVTAIRTLSTITKREMVNIQFDKRLRIPELTRICANETEADQFIELQQIQAVKTALIRWVEQRLYIYNKYPAAKGAYEKIQAAEAILAEITHHRYLNPKNAVQITAAIYWLRGYVYKLAPSQTSRYRKHYDEIILPSIDYCFYHSKKARMRII